MTTPRLKNCPRPATVLAALLLATLGACTVVPTYPVGYQHRPAYVETYPVYSYPGTSIYYQSGPRYFDSYGDRHYYGGRHYDDRQRGAMPLPPPMQLHRDIRRNLGLPRPPGFR